MFCGWQLGTPVTRPHGDGDQHHDYSPGHSSAGQISGENIAPCTTHWTPELISWQAPPDAEMDSATVTMGSVRCPLGTTAPSTPQPLTHWSACAPSGHHLNLLQSQLGKNKFQARFRRRRRSCILGVPCWRLCSVMQRNIHQLWSAVGRTRGT